jgi:hypothetical protein
MFLGVHPPCSRPSRQVRGWPLVRISCFVIRICLLFSVFCVLCGKIVRMERGPSPPIPINPLTSIFNGIYFTYMETKQYPLSLPLKDARQLAAAKKKSGLPVSQLILQCIRRALPDLVAEHGVKSRLTNVDPLPESVLHRIYSQPERDEAGTQQLMAAQAWEGD